MILSCCYNNVDVPILDKDELSQKFHEDEDGTPRSHLSRSLYLEIGKVNPA